MNVVQIGQGQAIGPALGDQARAFARAAFAANSRRAYAAQWRLWLAHYEASGLPSLLAAPEVVADWIASRAVSGMRAKYGHGGQSVATLRMAIAAIRAAHAAADQPFHSRHRAITLVMRGIAREKAELPAQAAPLQAKLIVEILAELGDSPLERRATQPSWRSAIPELGGGDGVLKIAAESLEVHLSRSKRANPGDPETFVVPREKNSAAVDAVDRWLSLANVRAGEPVLRRVHKY